MLTSRIHRLFIPRLSAGVGRFGHSLHGALILGLSACAPIPEPQEAPEASATPEPSITPDDSKSPNSPMPSGSENEPSNPKSPQSPDPSATSSSGDASTDDSTGSTKPDSGSDSPDATSSEDEQDSSSDPDSKVRDCDKIAWGSANVAVGQVIARGDVKGYIDKNADNKPERELVLAGMCEMHMTGKKCGIVNFGSG